MHLIQHRRLTLCFAAILVVACSGAQEPSAEPIPSSNVAETSEIDSDELDTEDSAEQGERISDEPEIDEDYERPPPYDQQYDVSELYGAVCVDCHGEQGDGAGYLEDGFSFASPAEEWSNGPHVDGILRTLEDGIHETAMRDFPQYKDSDRIELAEYILDLRRALNSADEDD